MSAERAVEAARERLRVIEDELARSQGELSEASAAARELPRRMVESFRKLAAAGALQRRWDSIVARVEATQDDGEQGLLQSLMSLLDECSEIARELLGERELHARARVEDLSSERRTLEWIIAEADTQE